MTDQADTLLDLRIRVVEGMTGKLTCHVNDDLTGDEITAQRGDAESAIRYIHALVEKFARGAL